MGANFNRIHLNIPQESNPTSPTSNDIPLFTFKSNSPGHSEQKRGSHDKDHALNPEGAFTIKLNSVPNQAKKASGLMKGILKHGSNEMIKLRPCDVTETSFCDETTGSDADDPSSSHSGEGLFTWENIPVLHYFFYFAVFT